ncbi:MAG TPA: RagB/SusD family nutrient uptake outer membrane protein [Prolixibacteraceae bacterium]|nr:RagB/SusD family nutrient uptake outer membrane protein [Prolixibacteraceae bacterium]
MRKLYLCFSTLTLISFTGCKDLLVENPKTFISSTNFYKTAGDFDAALQGIYVNLRNIVGTKEGKDVSEIFADYSDRPESAEQTGDFWKNNPSSNFWSIRYAWQYPYEIVNNANLILDALTSVNLTADVKSKIEAEAKLLRAYAYFNLVQYFGDIPLRITPCRSLAETQTPKSPQADVYALILSDLTFAEANLPESGSVVGRVNKYVAKALLARVYLTTAGFPTNNKANYALAKAKALEVINSPKYALKTDYADVFHQTTYTTESIWEALFSPPTIGNYLVTITAPTGNNTATLMPTADFINSFPVGDRRKELGIKDGYTNAKGNLWVKRTYYNKFVNPQFFEDELSPNVSGSSCGYTSPIIRLAEMYLIAAEAENEANGPANAYQYINIIRNRARINKADPTNVPDLADLSKEQFGAAVRMERKWELHLEGSAWFDMKRTQTFNKVQEARGASLVVPIGSYNNTWLIPDFEISNNNIDQNPSYGGN